MRLPIALALAVMLVACEQRETSAERALEQTRQLADQVTNLSAQLAAIEKEMAEVRASIERAPDPSPQLAAIEKELGEIKELAQLPEHEKMRRQHERQVAAARPTPPDPQVLSSIMLADHPTSVQAQQYVRDILQTLGDPPARAPNDPRTQMLTRVGPEHLEVLLDELASASGRPDTQHLQRAIESLAGPQHKQLILDRLMAQPTLFTIVQRMGWIEDAKPLLIEALKRQPASLSPQWITAVAKLRDPQTYDALKEAMIHSPQPATIYAELAHLPDIDLDDAVHRTWRRLERTPAGSGRASFVTIAIEHGVKDALGAMIGIIGVTDRFELHRSGWAFLDRSISPRQLVLRHIDFHGSDAEITVWYERNYHNLKFDKRRKVFYTPAEETETEEEWVEETEQ